MEISFLRMLPPPSTDLLVEVLSGSPDWQRLCQTSVWPRLREDAEREGLGPMVAFLARSHATAEQRAWCDEVLTRSWRRHDRALGEVSELVSLLERAGVQSLALKGPVLARRHYSPPFTRKPSGDLDIAVRTSDLQAAAQALRDGGYSTGSSVAGALRTEHHLVFSRDGRYRVELHFRLNHGVLGVPVEAFFPAARPYQIPNGPSVLVMDPGDELFGLILHLVNDRFARLFHSYEVLRLWDAASADVRQGAIDRIVRHRFVGVLRLCDISMQAVWGRRLVDPADPLPHTWLEGRLTESFYREMAATAGLGLEQPLSKRLRGRFLDLQVTDTPADAMRKLASLFWVTAGQLRHRNWRTGRIPQ